MKKIFAMLTACALMLSLCGLPSVGAAENVPDDTSIFFTDFDGYRVGRGEWTELHLTSGDMYSDYIYIPDIMDGAKLDDAHGTSLHMSGAGWQQAPMLIKDAANYDKVLFSFDFNVKAAGELGVFNVFATDHAEIIDVWVKQDGAIFINNVQYTQENAFTENQWVKMDIFVDYTNSKYIVYVNGNPIGTENVLNMGEVDKISGFNMQSFGGVSEAYVDNISISAPPAPPYAIDAMLPTGVAVGKTLDVTFSSGVNQDTLTTENIKITDSKGAPIAFTIAEKTANGVKLSFAEPLTAGECYSVDMSGVKGSLGQDVVCGNNKTEAYAGNNNLMFTNFNGYALGDGAWTENAFSNKDDNGNQQFRTDAGFAINVDGDYSNAMVQKTADENHGNSLYIGADGYSDIGFWYWYDGGYKIGNKYLISYDLKMGAVSENYFNILATDGTNIGVLFKGTGVSERNEVVPLKENAFEIGKWTRVELYLDTENKKYSVYVGGKLIGEEQSFEFNNPANPEVGAVHFRSFIDNENGIYIDNVGIASLDKMPIAKNEITLTAGENNTVIANYKATVERACVFIAAYDENGILLNAAYKTDQSVDGKGYESTLSMNKVDGAKTYKAFLWNDSCRPLCPASNPLTVQ